MAARRTWVAKHPRAYVAAHPHLLYGPRRRFCGERPTRAVLQRRRFAKAEPAARWLAAAHEDVAPRLPHGTVRPAAHQRECRHIESLGHSQLPGARTAAVVQREVISELPRVV
jgi:hypothetical protein